MSTKKKTGRTAAEREAQQRKRERIAELEAELLEDEQQRKVARRFFWTWFGIGVVVLVVGNGFVPWVTPEVQKLIRTVCVAIPPILAVFATVALMILSKVGVESKLARWSTTALWGASIVLTYEGMRALDLFGMTGETIQPATWTAWVFPITVDLPVAVALSCIRALSPRRESDIRRAKRDLMDALEAADTEGDRPTDRVSVNTSTDTNTVRDRSGSEGVGVRDRLSVNTETVREDVRADTETVREDVRADTETVREPVSVTDTVRVREGVRAGGSAVRDDLSATARTNGHATNTVADTSTDNLDGHSEVVADTSTDTDEHLADIDADILGRARSLVDAEKTSCSLTETARVLELLDAGRGPSQVSTLTGIPRGRVNRIREADGERVRDGVGDGGDGESNTHTALSVVR